MFERSFTRGNDGITSFANHFNKSETWQQVDSYQECEARLWHLPSHVIESQYKNPFFFRELLTISHPNKIISKAFMYRYDTLCWNSQRTFTTTTIQGWEHAGFCETCTTAFHHQRMCKGFAFRVGKNHSGRLDRLRRTKKSFLSVSSR